MIIEDNYYKTTDIPLRMAQLQFNGHFSLEGCPQTVCPTKRPIISYTSLKFKYLGFYINVNGEVYWDICICKKYFAACCLQ